jgi:hypothetical protein
VPQAFTVMVGTIFEDSKVPLHIWLQAMFLIAGSKKGILSNQLHRTLGVTLKTAWFMSHRIRKAMRSGDLTVRRYCNRAANGYNHADRAEALWPVLSASG